MAKRLLVRMHIKTKIMKDSWLTPKGEIIEVGYFQHDNYASDLLEAEMGLEGLSDYMDKNRMDSPYEVLHERGWIRIKYNASYLPKVEILGGCIDLTKRRNNTMNPAMNKIQLGIAKKICEEYNTPFHTAINDKRFW